MGCGCNKNKNKTAAVQVAAPKVINGNATSTATTTATGCNSKYELLKATEKKVVDLFNKFRISEPLKAPLYLKDQKAIRSYIGELNKECPPEPVWTNMLDRINKDYMQYIATTVK